VAPTACAFEKSSDGTLDTAVIGGGIAGLYAAWRLADGGDLANQVAVFEATDRIGGRLMSVSMPGTNGLVAEFGGMRFLTSQRIISSLVQHLGIDVRPFPMGGPEISSPFEASASPTPTMRARAQFPTRWTTTRPATTRPR
jgi:monoamine oxidase